MSQELQIVKDIQFRSAKKCTPKEIIIHHTWTYTVDKAIHTLKKQNYSTHYMIDRDGVIYQTAFETERMAHCVDHNWCGIGIDIVRGPNQAILLEQYTALHALILDIVKRWEMLPPILHKQTVFFHRDFRPTECPGKFDERALQF